MKRISYNGYRFPSEIIERAIWLYLRFTLSFRDVEDLLAERGIVVSYETVRRWVNHFGPTIAAHHRSHDPKTPKKKEAPAMRGGGMGGMGGMDYYQLRCRARGSRYMAPEPTTDRGPHTDRHDMVSVQSRDDAS
jgi:hypothetical protein